MITEKKQTNIVDPFINTRKVVDIVIKKNNGLHLTLLLCLTFREEGIQVNKHRNTEAKKKP